MAKFCVTEFRLAGFIVVFGLAECGSAYASVTELNFAV